MEKSVYFRKEEKEIFVYILIVLIETIDQYHNTYSREELNQRKFALLISFLSFDNLMSGLYAVILWKYLHFSTSFQRK